MSDQSQLPALASCPPPVPVEIPEHVAVSDAEMLGACQRLGLVGINKTTVKDLSSVGHYLHGAGIIRTQEGRVMVSQQRLDAAMRSIGTEIERLAKSTRKGRHADMARLAMALGSLTGRQCDAIKLMVNLSGEVNNQGQSDLIDGLVPSFGRGAKVVANPTVIMTREAHIHQNAESHPATTK